MNRSLLFPSWVWVLLSLRCVEHFVLEWVSIGISHCLIQDPPSPQSIIGISIFEFSAGIISQVFDFCCYFPEVKERVWKEDSKKTLNVSLLDFKPSRSVFLTILIGSLRPILLLPRPCPGFQFHFLRSFDPIPFVYFSKEPMIWVDVKHSVQPSINKWRSVEHDKRKRFEFDVFDEVTPPQENERLLYWQVLLGGPQTEPCGQHPFSQHTQHLGDYNVHSMNSINNTYFLLDTVFHLGGHLTPTIQTNKQTKSNKTNRWIQIHNIESK